MSSETTSGYTVGRRRILLRRFVVNCEIGIHDFELRGKQPVAIDVTLEIRPGLAQVNDDIGSVVDYDFLRVGIGELVARGRYNLQERLCEDIVGLCFSHADVIGATVRTCKTDVYPDCDAVCYEMTASR
jgi:dihydroneopterin aldolase